MLTLLNTYMSLVETRVHKNIVNIRRSNCKTYNKNMLINKSKMEDTEDVEVKIKKEPEVTENLWDTITAELAFMLPFMSKSEMEVS